MSARAFVLLLGLGVAPATRAEVLVELVPDNPGPYTGGESLTVDVWLHSEISWDVVLPVVQLDFSQSHPGVSLSATFTFDFSAIPDDGGGYNEGFTSTELPVPRAANLWGCVCPEAFLPLPGAGSLHIGSLGVTVPTAAGTYRVDAVNALEPDELLGAFITTDPVWPGDPPGELWRAFTGEITGGIFDFVIPPPIPALSGWGVIVLSCLLLTVGVWRITRRAEGDIENPTRSRKRGPRFSWSVAAVCTSLLSQAATAIPTGDASVPFAYATVTVDSGLVSASGAGGDPIVVFSEFVGVEDARWVRLHFEQVQLSGSPESGDESFLRITSLEDGAVQIQGSVALGTWTYTSAYFNGDEVLLELLAYPNTGDNRVVVDQIAFGDPEDPEGGLEHGICGDTDDRVRSYDVRAGRYRQPRMGCKLTGMCSAFLFDDRPNDLLTAGHCCKYLLFACDTFSPLVEFNVPDSRPYGAFRVSAPEDQYPIEQCSAHYQYDGIGDDWCFLRVSNNTDTGLSPLEAQGESYRLFRGVVPNPVGETLRMIGYGEDETPWRWYCTQQSAIGPYEERQGTFLTFQVDARRGSSGSAVEHQCSGVVYGIFTHLGCHIPSHSVNYGTTIDHPGLQAVLGAPEPSCDDCNDNGAPDECDVDCNAPGCSPPCGASNDCNLNNIPDECELDKDCNENGAQDICDIYAGTSEDCDGNFVPDECESDDDCNTNQTLDVCDVIEGTSEDCNLNLVPDECEPDADCQPNGTRDICDIGAGISNDCNCNNVPDECEPPDDCNNNGTQDICDIYAGTSEDCNDNIIPDECEVPPLCPTCPDCNDNGIPDDCDITAGTSWDCDENGVPDECQAASGACCLADGSCHITLETCCASAGGSFVGTATCDPGGCCLADGGCEDDVPEACCVADGGAFLGPEGYCEGGEEHACCVEDAKGRVQCIDTTEQCCQAWDGGYYPNKTCATPGWVCPTQNK